MAHIVTTTPDNAATTAGNITIVTSANVTMAPTVKPDVLTATCDNITATSTGVAMASGNVAMPPGGPTVTHDHVTTTPSHVTPTAGNVATITDSDPGNVTHNATARDVNDDDSLVTGKGLLQYLFIHTFTSCVPLYMQIPKDV